MSDRYGSEGHLLRRWTMSASGEVSCFHDAIDTRINPASVVSAVEAHNALLHAAKAERAAYEAALRVPDPTGEPETIPAPTEEDPDATAPNPLWTEWNAAQATIANLSDEVRDWIDADQAEPEAETEEHDAWSLAVIGRDAVFRDTAPVFVPVTDSPLLQPLRAWAFWAVVDATEGLRDAVYAAITAIPDPIQRAATKARFERTDEYKATDPLFTAMRPAVGMTDEEFEALWSTGLAIQNAA